MKLRRADGSTATGTRPPNPFPGLRPYQPHEAKFFFGRDGETDELIRRPQMNCAHDTRRLMTAPQRPLSASLPCPVRPCRFASAVTMRRHSHSIRRLFPAPAGAVSEALQQLLNGQHVVGGSCRHEV